MTILREETGGSESKQMALGGSHHVILGGPPYAGLGCNYLPLIDP